MFQKLLLTTLCAAAVLLLSQQVFAASSSEDEIKVRRVEMALPTATVRVNQVRTLYVEIVPYNADDQTIYWSTSNPDVVLVDGEGMITGVSPGTAEVTATSYNGKSDVCIVTVPGTPLVEAELQTSNAQHPLADASGGELLSAATLRLDVETAAKSAVKGEKVRVIYSDKRQVSTAALRSAAYSASYQGREAALKFRTLDSAGAIQGQLTIDPAKAGSEDAQLRLEVYTAPEKTEQACSQAAAKFGGNPAVVHLGQEGAYGMTVQVAARVALPDTFNSLSLYHYGAEGYTLLADQSVRIDDSGFLHFSTERGGNIVIVPV